MADFQGRGAMRRTYRRFVSRCVWNLEKAILWLGGHHGLGLADWEPFGRAADVVFECCWRYHSRHKTAWWQFIQMVAQEKRHG